MMKMSYTICFRLSVKVTDPTTSEPKKLTSLNLCYSGLYHRKFISSFSNPPFKRDIPDKCVLRNIHSINNNHFFIIMALTKPLGV